MYPEEQYHMVTKAELKRDISEMKKLVSTLQERLSETRANVHSHEESIADLRKKIEKLKRRRS